MKPSDMKVVFFFMASVWMISSCSSSKIASNGPEWDDTYVRSSREKMQDSTSSREKKTGLQTESIAAKPERLSTFYGPYMPGFAPFSPFGYNPYGYYSDPMGYTYGNPLFYGSYYNPYSFNPWGSPVGRVPSGGFSTPPNRPTRPTNPPVNTQNWNTNFGSRPGSGTRGGWNNGSGFQGNSGFNSGSSFNNNHSNFNSGGSGGFSTPSSGGARPSTGGRGGR